MAKLPLIVFDVNETLLDLETMNPIFERIFGELSTWLPGLIQSVNQAPIVEPEGPFPVAQQRALCERTMALLAFDFHAGRLDASAHPFSGGVPEDVRLTTRYRDHEFERSLMATIHEIGHGRYELRDCSGG